MANDLGTRGNRKVPGIYTSNVIEKPASGRRVFDANPIFGLELILERGTYKPFLVTPDTMDVLVGDYISGGIGKYILKDAFANGATEVMVSRVFTSSADYSSVTLQDASPADTGIVYGKTKGTYYDNLQVIIEKNTASFSSDLGVDAVATDTVITLANPVDDLLPGDRILIDDGSNTEYADIVSVDVENKKAYLAAGLTNPYTAVTPTTVTVQEFSLTIESTKNGNTVQVEDTYEKLSKNPNSPRFWELVITDENYPAKNGGSNYITIEDDPISEDVPADGTFALTGGDDGLSGLADSDWTDFDTRWKTAGIQALACENQTTAVTTAGITYVKSNEYIAGYLFSGEASDSTADDYKTYRLSLGYTEKAWMYGPYFDTPDPDGPAAWSTKKVPPIGYVIGVIKRFDNAYDIVQAPAGLDDLAQADGRVYNIAADYIPDEDHDDFQKVLHPVNVNVIRQIGDVYTVWGTRTLSKEKKHLYLMPVRFLTYSKNLIKHNMNWVIFKTVNAQLLKNVESYLQFLHNDYTDRLEFMKFECPKELNTEAELKHENGGYITARATFKFFGIAEFFEVEYKIEV